MTPASYNSALNRWTIWRDGKLVYRYRALMEEHIGRPLASDEHVHHINGDSSDDRIENLMLVTAAEHAKLHDPDRRAWVRRGWKHDWSAEHERCVECGTVDRPHTGHGRCSRCYFRNIQRVRHGHEPRRPPTIVTVICAQCGTAKDFSLHDGGSKRMYCSQSCAGRATANARWAREREIRAARG